MIPFRPLLTGRPPAGILQRPQAPQQQNPLADQAQQAVDAARGQLESSQKALTNKSGMVRVVVETAKIICSETNPAKKQNVLKVPEERSRVEGRKLAQVQDVQRDKHIAPWPCECKKRPKPGGGYLPCDYKPQGVWTPGVHTETNDAKEPKKRSQAEEEGRKAGEAQAKAGVDNIANDPQTMNALQNAADKTGQSFNDLATKSIIESTGNRFQGANKYGFQGLMQMGPGAAQDVGMPFSSMIGPGNVANNALGGARYMNYNAGLLPSGVPRDGFHLYMAHQQGARGTSDLLKTLASNPNAPLTAAQSRQLDLASRLGRPATQQDFFDYFKGKYEAVEDAVEKRFGPPATIQAVPEVAVHKCTYGGTIRIVQPGQNTKKAKLGGASIKP